MALYDDVISLASLYMGPAAGKFVSRQLSAHLQVEPTRLNKQHLDELAKWVFISGKLLMSEPKAQEFSDGVKKLKM